MPRPHEVVSPLLRLLAAAGLLLVACSDGTGPLDITGIRLTLSTSGADLDPDGYALTLDDDAPRAVRVNDEVTFHNVAPGAHVVALGGLATNCTSEGGNVRNVTVEEGRQVAAAFDVACILRVGTVTFIIRTSGIDPDPDGYALMLDGTSGLGVGASDSLTVGSLREGTRTFRLTDVATNCTTAPAASQTVDVTFGDSLRVEFDVTCVARLGDLRVSLTTSGTDVDPDGYALVIDGGAPLPLGVNGSATVSALREGLHTIEITGVASNCSTVDGFSRAVIVAFARVTLADFAVTCSARVGSMRITTITSGVEMPTGYAVTVGDAAPRPVPINGSVTIANLRERTHAVTLSGVTANCRVDDGNPRDVAVTYLTTVDVTFRVTCVARRGAMRVTAVTTGEELDPDGYTVEIGHEDYYYDFDTVTTRPLGTNASVVVEALLVKQYDVRIVGMARNCRPTSWNPARVTVVLADTSRVVFTVECVATGSLRIDLATSGLEPDADGYVLDVSSANAAFRQTERVGTSGGTTITGLVPNTYQVRLDSVAPNCSVSGGPTRSVTVTGGSEAAIALDVQCVATGTLRLSATSTGSAPDADGFKGSVVGAGDSRTFTLAADGGATSLTRLAPGTYALRLRGVAENCQSAQPTTQQVAIGSGETTTIAFALSCSVPTRLAYVLGYGAAAEIHVSNSNGTEAARLTTNAARDAGPTWSFDGQRVAFGSSRAGALDVSDIYHMNSAGTDVVRRTLTGTASSPTWSPDGRRLAFASSADIYITSAVEDGSGATRLAASDAYDDYPAWSPDGTKIAFTSWRGGAGEIYVVNVDGTGLTRVSRNAGTNVVHEWPAWSPDGRMLAMVGADCYYYCDYWVGVMNADGTGLTRLAAAAAGRPAWSPDGRTIAFELFDAADGPRIHYIRVDGSHEDLLLAGAHSPSWRR